MNRAFLIDLMMRHQREVLKGFMQGGPPRIEDTIDVPCEVVVDEAPATVLLPAHNTAETAPAQ